MTYIIENASLLSNRRIERTSLLIKHGRIASVQTAFNKLTQMRMDATPFIMTPTYVQLTHCIPNENDFHVLKDYFTENFIKRGCTTVLTTVDVQYEFEFPTKLKKKLASLNTIPIDYVIGVKIPVRLLTPSFIRTCKREKIPAIFVVIENEKELFDLPWGWIRESLFPYNCPLIPIFPSGNNNKETQQIKGYWKRITTEAKIPSVVNEMPEKEPISKRILAKIGIFPLKSNIQQGGEVSYNFYMVNDEDSQVEELELFHYYSHRLVVTVHKGKVIRSGDEVIFHSGYGEHVKIKTPSFYIL